MTLANYSFHAPPGWQVPDGDWLPPDGWTPDPSWPPAPEGWEFWVRRVAAPPPPPSDFVTSEPLPTVAADLEDRSLRRRISELEAEVTRLRPEAADDGTVQLDDERILQEVGIYRYHHPLENAAEYKTQLDELGDEIKTMIKAGDAVLA